MTRLIVEEAGQRRAFQVGEGILTIGSGATATLKLASAGVAEVHAELLVRGGKITLRPKPGVLPPLLGGLQVVRETEIPPGVGFSIGDAKLRVEVTGAAPAPAPAPAAAPAPAPAPMVHRSSPAAGAASRRPATAAKGGSARSGAKEQEPPARRTPKKANLAPVYVVIGLLVAGGAFFLSKDVFFRKSTAGQWEILGVAREDIQAGSYGNAKGRLDAIAPASLRDPEFKKAYDAVVAEIERAKAAAGKLDRNLMGTRYLQTQLMNFESRYLKNEIDKPKVRVFLQRAAEFRRLYPGHEQMDWVDRQETRFKGVVDLSKPPDYEDIAFEVTALTWTDTRDYKRAFEILDAFVRRASGEELAKAQALIETKKTERAAWYEDRLLQARYEYDNQKVGKSVAILVTILTKSGDPAMAENAVDQLLLFPDLDEWLRGYKSSQPDVYEEIVAHPRIGAFAAKEL